jgi:hypothetical protein
MANSKISALPAASTPLAGTELVPVVQGGITEQVSVANLTAGRTVAMSNATVGSGGTTSFATGIVLNGTNNAGNGAYIQGQRNSSPAWFLGDTAAALGSGTGYITYVYGANPFIVYTANGEALNITSSQDVKATLGNFVVGTSGKGIDFSATPGTGTSELLADYEEGTWTPVVASSIGAITAYTASGKYTKIGRAVVLSCNIIITNNGTGAGYLSITGVPFNAAAANAEAGCGLEYAAVGFSTYVYFLSTTTLAMASYINAYPGGTGYRIAAEITYQT